MGISGLNTFFDNNPHLSRPYELHDTKVVIDGNNLANTLYFDCGADCVHNGDYSRYAMLVKDYFLLYLQCDIEPIVIFDGGYDRTDCKLGTVIKRTSRRLKYSVRISKQLFASGNVLPILAIRVFKDVLQEMGIRCAQCPFEADAEITAIANHYQCPVISKDSDFYVFDITAGFIRLDYIDVNVQKKDQGGQSYCFLKCVIYHVDSFLSLFPGVEKCVLPLFSTLMGNDFVDEFVFNNFFLNTQFPSVEFKNLQLGERHKQMIGLLLWLKHRDVSSATEEVLMHIKEREKMSVKKLMEQAIDAYKFENSDFLNYFDQVSCSCTNSNAPQLYTSKNNTLPTWFSEQFCEMNVCPFLLNAVCLRRVFLLSQVENTALVSTYTCSLYIRQVLYGLLLSLDGVSESNAPRNCIEEYDRVGETLQQISVKPVFLLEGFGDLPKLSEEQMDTATARRIVLYTLGEQRKFLRSLPDFLQLFVMSVRYYLRNCSPKPSEDFFDTFLFVVVYLSIAEPLIPEHLQSSNHASFDYQKFSCEDFRNVPILDMIENITPSNALFLRRKLKAHLQKQIKGHHLILPIVHSYGQLQGCLNFALMLNELVGSPFETPRIHTIISGTLTHSLTKEVMEQELPNLFIHDALGPDSTLDHLFQKLKKKVLKNLPADCLKLRKKKRNAAKNSPKLHSQSQKTSVVGWTNKFDALRYGTGANSSANVFI